MIPVATSIACFAQLPHKLRARYDLNTLAQELSCPDISGHATVSFVMDAPPPYALALTQLPGGKWLATNTVSAWRHYPPATSTLKELGY